MALMTRPLSTIVDTPPAGTLRARLPPANPGDVLWLRWIPANRVPVKFRALCDKHVARAAGALAIREPITVRYFETIALGRPMTDRVGYAEVTDMIAPPQAGVDMPFYVEREGEEPGGVASDSQPNVVGINVAMKGRIVAGVLAHEVRHAAQQALSKLLGDPDWRERDAEGFMDRYLATVPDEDS